MSELKSFNSERIYWAVEQVERMAGDIDELHLDDNLFYLKSEADKVIAEKDAEIAELQKQVHDYAKGLYVIQARAEMEARHHKYKRCLAMARWCMARYNEWDAYYPTTTTRKMMFLDKWERRWRELAQFFK